MAKKRIVMAIGHKDLGTNLPEQKAAVARTAKVIADFIQEGWQVAIVHSNAPQVGMIHTAMNEFGKQHDGYSQAPMSVCSAMSQGYIGYDLQNGIRAELIKRGIYKPVRTDHHEPLGQGGNGAQSRPSRTACWKSSGVSSGVRHFRRCGENAGAGDRGRFVRK